MSLVTHLIRKDLFLGRWLILGTTLAGLVSVAMLPLSRVAYFVGSVSLLCVLIVLNLFIVFQLVIGERKEKTLLFVLSLPVSTTQYAAAKVASCLLAFLVPWLLLTLGSAIVIDRSAIPNGMIPMSLAVLTYLLAYFCVFLGVALQTDSGAWTTTVIIIGNIAVNFLIPWLMSRPSFIANHEGPVALWTPDVVGVIAAEVIIGLLALGVSLFLSARNRNFVS